MPNNKKEVGNWKIDWGRQGRVIFAYLIVFLLYYGIIVNIFMYMGEDYWFSFVSIPEIVKQMIFWTYELLFVNPVWYFADCLLLYLICFWLTYKEDIPHYGIRASIWLVLVIIFEGFLFYVIMFGFSIEPFLLQFASIKGYINLLVLLGTNICGAISGMYLKKYISTLREI
ncbi:MAG: hypothetical protein ACTSV5_09965 [Promethearchaeota archaeon]